MNTELYLKCALELLLYLDQCINHLIAGDNLDIYIRTAHERQNKTNTDLHMFASNIIFPRIATPDISNLPPEFHLEEMRPEMLLLHGHYKRHLENAYNVLISKNKENSYKYMCTLNTTTSFST